jgi:hypothetical protein
MSHAPFSVVKEGEETVLMVGLNQTQRWMRLGLCIPNVLKGQITFTSGLTVATLGCRLGLLRFKN